MKLRTDLEPVIPLDVLNNHYQPLARYEARLLDLHGDWATLTVPSNAAISCLHWGSLVRFTFSDGAHYCLAEGVVVAHRAGKEIASPASVFPADAPGEEAVDTAQCREITVQLWQCRHQEERRLGPRRWSRIPVLLRPEREGVAPHPGKNDFGENDFGMDMEACWERGWAVDLSANGMRLRAHVRLPVRQRVSLQFTLPDSSDPSSHSGQDAKGEEAEGARQRFLLTGRILRTERTRTAASHEAMICFENLTAEQGVVLSRFLAGDW